MEDIRTEQEWHLPEDERQEWNVSPADDEVPFHVPRD
jgi:hypothetical protein